MEERDQVLNEEGQARRRFLKQAGAVAWGAPLIVTMMSRSAIAQTGCGTVNVSSLCDVTTPCGSASVCTPPVPPTVGAQCTCVTSPVGP